MPYTGTMLLRRPSFALMLALALPGCFIVIDDEDEDDMANDGTSGGSAADETGALPACGDPGTFSTEDENGDCVCEVGLVWCTENIDDLNCCVPLCGDPGTNSVATTNDQCECVAGYDWCSSDPQDVNCCAI